MKGKSCTIVFFVIIALAFTTVSGYSKSTVHKPVKRTPQQASARLDSEGDYLVRPGDTLIQIARNFATTPAVLKSVNGLKSNRIKAGQTLHIPQAETATKPEDPRPVENSSTANEYYLTAGTSGDTDQAVISQEPSTRLKLVEAGFQLIGVRYRFGGSGTNGFDCSGLVKNLFSKFNIELPRSSKEQFKQGQKVGRDELEIGDLVFFSSGGTQPTHVGIYIGNNQFLHAARKAKQVVVSDLSKLWYTMRYLGARRVMDLWADQPATE